MKLPKLVCTDVDGVLTDGGMYYDEKGNELKKFNVADGWGVRFLKDLSIPVMIITGEDSACVKKRGEKLKIDFIYTGISNKLEFTLQFCEKHNLTLEDLAFIGDDLNDLKLLRRVGISGAPGDAPTYVKKEVDIVTETYGGHGAFRAFVETILRKNDKLDMLIESFR